MAYLVAQAQPKRIKQPIIEDAAPPFPRTRPVPKRPDDALPFDWAVTPVIVEKVNDPTRRWWTHLPKITAPTLPVGGGPTGHIPKDLLVEVSELVPDCTLVTIPAGHNVHKTEPDKFLKHVLKWPQIER